MKKTIAILIVILLISVAVYAAPADEMISVKKVSSFTYCFIKHTGPFTEIETVIKKLMFSIQSQNVGPTGPMIGVYYNSPQEVPSEELEWEIGFPVTPQVPVQQPLEKKQWEYTQVASSIHVGPYEDAGNTIVKIIEWMAANGYTQTGPVMERYLTMPTPDTQPEDLRAEIWVPVQKK